MRRLLPWLLLGVLVWVSVLGVALGLSFTSNTTSVHSSGTSFVPTWTPAGVTISGGGEVCKQVGSNGGGFAVGNQQVGGVGVPSGAAIVFTVTSCGLRNPPGAAGSQTVPIDGRTVTLIKLGG
jgi:hypothetical protein